MARKAKKKNIKRCPAGHTSNDFVCSGRKNRIYSNGVCYLCTKKNFIQEFGTWTDANIQWIPYDNFCDIEHIADGGHSTVSFAVLKNVDKRGWRNFNYDELSQKGSNRKVTLKELNDSKYGVSEFLKMVCFVFNLENFL